MSNGREVPLFEDDERPCGGEGGCEFSCSAGVLVHERVTSILLEVLEIDLDRDQDKAALEESLLLAVKRDEAAIRIMTELLGEEAGDE